MPNRDLRTQGCAVAFVEMQQLLRRFVPCHFAVGFEEYLPHGGGAQMLAFHGEKSQFISDIENAIFALELQAIDDNRFHPEPDVFGPKIAVSLDDFSCSHTLIKQFGFFP